MRRAIAGAAALAAVLIGTAACTGSANQKDVRGVQAQSSPDNIKAFANRLPEWDWACPKPPGFEPYKGSPTNLLGDHLVVHQDAG